MKPGTPDLVRQAAAVEGAEGRYISDNPRFHRQILMLWGPQADLARDPRWGRSEEVYGEDPFFKRHHGGQLRPWAAGPGPQPLAGRRAFEALPRQQQ